MNGTYLLQLSFKAGQHDTQAVPKQLSTFNILDEEYYTLVKKFRAVQKEAKKNEELLSDDDSSRWTYLNFLLVLSIICAGFFGFLSILMHFVVCSMPTSLLVILVTSLITLLSNGLMYGIEWFLFYNKTRSTFQKNLRALVLQEARKFRDHYKIDITYSIGNNYDFVLNFQ